MPAISSVSSSISSWRRCLKTSAEASAPRLTRRMAAFWRPFVVAEDMALAPFQEPTAQQLGHVVGLPQREVLHLGLDRRLLLSLQLAQRSGRAARRQLGDRHRAAL